MSLPLLSTPTLSSLQEFGIDIVGEDNTTIIHHKVAARAVCVFSDHDAQIAARAEQHHQQQQQQQQQQQPRRADVYYDYGTVHDLSISESSLVDDDDEKGMQMCYRGQHDWRTEYGLGGILCAIVRCQIMVVLTFSLTCL